MKQLENNATTEASPDAQAGVVAELENAQHVSADYFMRLLTSRAGLERVNLPPHLKMIGARERLTDVLYVTGEKGMRNARAT